MKCQKCGNEAQDDAIFCDQCGQRLVALEALSAVTATTVPAAAPAADGLASATVIQHEDGVCPKCGVRHTPGEAFCAECGAPLDAPQPTAVRVSLAPQSPLTGVDRTPCPTCGAQLEPGDAFCFACGAALAGESAAAARPMAEQPAALVEEPLEARPLVPQPAPAVAVDECPSCGAKGTPGDAYCDYCGAALVQLAASAAGAAQTPMVTRAAGGPRLQVGATNAEIALPEGAEVLLGREDPVANVFPEVDLTPYGAEEAGVSRRHCKITLAEGCYAIQDLSSTNGTLVNRTRLQPGVPVAIRDGDEIRVGRLKIVFRVGA